MRPPAWLTTLIEKGSVGYSAANRNQLNELTGLGIVSIKSAGIRRTVTVSDFSQLERWVQARYPEHTVDPQGLLIRGGNIVRSGTSKAGKRSHDVLSLQFKWFGKQQDRLTQITGDYGMAAVLTDRVAELVLPATWQLLTIENWEPFFHADYTDTSDAVMVVYLGGNVSDIAIRALTEFHPPPQSTLHFGDYDWEGLYIFQRLQKTIPWIRLYIPDDIESLFAEFGNRRLVERQSRKTGFDMNNRACLPIIELIAQFNAGLEQEIVALPLSSAFSCR